ncbi:MAG: hypothetical protein CEO22_98 [Candidatus Berkelbacteria bacterium Gr01-1014_85]|uniref:F5/8 type C domain-containing protein n=1 Tax=Candidatus Berkelbacteria bacterium Gr01-1014_85 TaxID=2017150 RepID=A0A554JDP0_9BACT|nr:MAG: hypothetical protein CEO22_98 [Candidatus Berkelbacteria bacterium Gr01-1014_85]
MSLKQLRIFFSDNWRFLLPILSVGIISWYPTLDFWFLKAFEASWLNDAWPYSLPGLIRTHAFIYWLNLKVFGWNAWGWYLVAIVLQLIAAIVFFKTLLALTKDNRLIATASSLFFVANIAYHDVITWGSFNSYYPLLLIWMLLSLLQFYYFKTTGKIKHYYLTVSCLILAFYTRETGILMIPLLTVFDLLTTPGLNRLSSWWPLIKRQIAFYALIVVFLVLREVYGGTIGDTVDSNYKLQVRLLHDRAYGEYLRIVALTFGKLIPPILLPYPWLNEWRSSLLVGGDADWLRNNFFSRIGYATYFILALPALVWRQRPIYGKLFAFSWVWIGACCLFIAALLPAVNEVLVRDYEEITSRYRYFAFVAATVIYGGLLSIFYERLKTIGWLKRFKPLPMLVWTVIVAAVAVFNILELHRIERLMNKKEYADAKNFHQIFRKEFPTLPKKAAFYIYPHAANINNYLFEWYLIKDNLYPNLKGENYKIETQIGAVLLKLTSGKAKLNDFQFLDYSDRLINRTAELKAIILGQKPLPLTFQKTSHNLFSLENLNGPAVELPQQLSFKAQAGSNLITVPNSRPDSQRFRALVDYTTQRDRYLRQVKITTCTTISQRDYEPFLHYHPDHLSDGNVGRRSTWIADALPGWVVAELAQKQTIIGAAWGSLVPRVPSTYSYYSSDDGVNWQPIKTFNNNKNQTALDRFDRPITAKYFKIQIDSTGSGDFVQLDEFELLSADASEVLSSYNDRNELLTDSRELYRYYSSPDDQLYAQSKGLNFGWAKLTWGVDQGSPHTDSQITYFRYDYSGKDALQVKIPEAEYYAEPGQLLQKHYRSFELDFTNSPFAVTLEQSELQPQYPITAEAVEREL